MAEVQPHLHIVREELAIRAAYPRAQARGNIQCNQTMPITGAGHGINLAADILVADVGGELALDEVVDPEEG